MKVAPKTLGDFLAEMQIGIDDVSDAVVPGIAEKLLIAEGVYAPTPQQRATTEAEMRAAINAGKWKTFVPSTRPSLLNKTQGAQDGARHLFFSDSVFSAAQLNQQALTLEPEDAQKLRGAFETGLVGKLFSATFIASKDRADGDFSRTYGDATWERFMRATHLVNRIERGAFLSHLDVNLINACDAALRGSGAIPKRSAAPSTVAARVRHATESLARDPREPGVAAAMRPRLQVLIERIKEEARKPDADMIGAAARFERDFVAMGPLSDNSLRAARIIMNRVLMEFGFAPAVLRDDLDSRRLSPEQWRREVAAGCARGKRVIEQTRLHDKSEYAATFDAAPLSRSPDQPITVAGLPFDLGMDGFLYDPTGKPWLFLRGQIVAVGQLEHLFIVRRYGQVADGGLGKLTAETRAFFDLCTGDPSHGEAVDIRPDKATRRADTRYALGSDPDVLRLLADACQVEKLTHPFEVADQRGSALSAAMSKYAQIDLEFWYIEQALARAGMKANAADLRAQRSLLFDRAKSALGPRGAPVRFEKNFEKMMYEASPLRYANFEEAQREEGDEETTVWRGDYAISRWVGMAPNNDIRQTDAKHVATARGSRHQLADVYDDLMRLQGSALGSQYICLTTDLGLLSGAFADNKRVVNLNLNVLPKRLASAAMAWATPQENGSRKIAGKGMVSGTVLDIRANEEAQMLSIEAERRAFGLRVNKASILPGIVALSRDRPFEGEQEVHGLQRVFPWQVRVVKEASYLGQAPEKQSEQ